MALCIFLFVNGSFQCLDGSILLPHKQMKLFMGQWNASLIASYEYYRANGYDKEEVLTLATKEADGSDSCRVHTGGGGIFWLKPTLAMGRLIGKVIMIELKIKCVMHTRIFIKKLLKFQQILDIMLNTLPSLPVPFYKYNFIIIGIHV